MTAPGEIRRRGNIPTSAGYAVFDCETTGTDPERDEIVSFALVLLDPDGNETGRFGSVVRPSCAIPEEASAIHGIRDADVADAPTLAELAGQLLERLDGRVFVAHNASFDLTMLRCALRTAGLEYRPPAVACTLDAFRVLEPLAREHRLEAICAHQGVQLAGAHDAMRDAEATAALVKALLDLDLAPESARLDLDAFMRLRTRGDTRPASEPQIRRVFALARIAGLAGSDGRADRGKVCELILQVAGVDEPDRLTREKVQDVYDELERLITENDRQAA
ncbi:MAG TPA: 3'-5' exonuclease [Gaiellaceae bacterium]|nr:3'-5' exonuclease [Gaiellaceae bacterium]